MNTRAWKTSSCLNDSIVPPSNLDKGYTFRLRSVGYSKEVTDTGSRRRGRQIKPCRRCIHYTNATRVLNWPWLSILIMRKVKEESLNIS